MRRLIHHAAHHRDHGFQEPLRIPEVGLEKEQLTTGLQEAKHPGELFRISIMTENSATDDEVVGPLGVPVEIIKQHGARRREGTGAGPREKIGRFDGGHDRGLAAEGQREMLRPDPASGANLQHPLAGHDVQCMSHRVGAPAQSDPRGVRRPRPEAFAVHLQHAERLGESSGQGHERKGGGDEDRASRQSRRRQGRRRAGARARLYIARACPS